MNDRIIKTEYSEVMQKSYIDYAMSVIVARALPDVRDGLKPVQRRTLYDMHELKIHSDKPYRKSARIVGDTMGKYHPHGDSSIYDALVVMSQDFKKGIPLVDGHGNFGNIEGDGAAAMRYTEARLAPITEQGFLADLDKDVVDFIPNFDETEQEPSVLPVKIPNLLVNGSEGIAVGMATSIPPHNLQEVIEATKAYMENPDITTEELMRYVKGPDFPTGGIVINQSELLEIYETGTGKIKVRGKVEIEKAKGGHFNVVITEIPYPMIGANIGKFLSDVAALAENKTTQDIVDITNQSSKEGIRIVVELKRDADPENFKNMLYKKTRLEDTFGVNMLAICDGRPETLGLKQIIAESVKFQYEVNTRKYTNLLAKEQEKREIQEGLIRACNVIDLIIEILRGSRDRKQVKNCLVNGETEGIRFKSKESEIMAGQLNFTEKQANAILEMQLYKLIGLEIDALMKEHDKTMTNIYRYEDILESKHSMQMVIMQELDTLAKTFGRSRRTTIENAAEAVFEVKEKEEMDLFFLMDRFGYCKTIDEATYNRNRESCEKDFLYVVPVKSSGRICLFTEDGMMHSLRVKDVPLGKYRDKGIPLDNISNFQSAKETILTVASQKDLNLYRMVFVTNQSMMKIVSGGEFDVTKRTVAATKLNDGEKLISVRALTDERDIILRSEEGYYLRFPIYEIPVKKKTAVGVRGMKLGPKDQLTEVFYIHAFGEETVTIDENLIPLSRFKIQSRDGKGTKMRL